MNENQEARIKLQEELKKLFQFDVSDLDFGVYRILNRKKDQIEKFIEKDLLDAVNEGLKEYQQQDASQLEDIKQQIKENLSDDAFDDQGNLVKYENTKLGKEYLQALEKAEKQQVGADTEKKIYNDLFTFFSRYYSDGDFVTKRRISTRDSKYAIPYNGEEVLLHWANKDQYYVKTEEHFTNYKFEVDGKSVWFKVAQAEQDRDNVKEEEERSFVPHPENPIEVNNDELTIWFDYRPLTNEEQEQWLKIYKSVENSTRKTIDRRGLCIAYDEWIRKEVDIEWRKLLSVIPQNKDRSILYQKLNHYTGKNTTDYFIHKDLQSFLERELEYYLKNEVIRIDDFIEDKTEQAMEVTLTRAKVVRQIGQKIIAFLRQIENFQKKLFEKRKFVVDTHYCFTLDRVPEELYDTILQNEKQLKKWEELYAMDQWSGELTWDGKWTKEFLIKHPFLMVDTKCFDDDEEFKFELLATINDLEEGVGGLLINGENFQAINLLRSKFLSKVKSVYIDPPYNSKSTEIIYKNSYKHSSWLSLMENRISLSQDLLREDAVYAIAIDENEQERLGLMLSDLFPDKDKTCVSIIHNPGGIQGNNFSYSHEYAFFIYPTKNRIIGLENREEDADTRPLRDVSTGDHLREDAANCFYPILVKDQEIIDFGDVCEDDFHPESPNVMRDDGVMEIYPIDAKGNERKWVFARNTVESIKGELAVEYNSKRKIYDIIRTKTHFNYKTVWTREKYNANIFGSKVLNNLIPDNTFTFPKSVHNVKDCVEASSHDVNEPFILDFFAGSGTTGHSVLKLNKEDGGNRKYILVEMGQYFDSVLKPRIQKVAFSYNWKNGIPQDQDGQSHAFKYHFIESYEDVLNNIDFKNPEDTQQAMPFKDYMLSYMLDFETQGVSASLLKDGAIEAPFDYKLKIQRGHEAPKKETVDLVETFHYLIGLWVQKLRRVEHQSRKYIISTGQIWDEDAVEDVCIIWRNTKDLALDEEAVWIQKEIIKDQTFDRIYINGVSKVKDAEPIEITFREKMFESIT